MNVHAKTSPKSVHTPTNSKSTRADLDTLKAVIARGDYVVPATEIATKMLSAKVFRFKKHG